MKKVLFIISDMKIGGTRTSLLNLLSHLTTTFADIHIDLYIMAHYGELMDRIPTKVFVIPEDFIMGNSLPKNQRRSAIAGIYHIGFHCAKEIIGYKRIFSILFPIVAQKIYDKYGEYDAVIGYQEGISNNFVRYIKAKKHYVWIHNDIDKWYDEKVFIYETYNEANKIIFVAEASRFKFCDKFKKLKDKTDVIKNTIDADLIVSKSRDISKYPYWGNDGKTIQLISVGRVTEQKAFERIISVVKELRRCMGDINFRWLIVGDGPLLPDLRKKIEDEDLTPWIILIEGTDNPYPYIRKSSLLVVTSLYESQPMVILEALTLGVPVLSTRFSSSEEIIQNKGYGIICDNSEESITKSLVSILNNPNILKTMKEAAVEYGYDNQTILSQVRKLI
jgi:glycosyltransferase involved in cell wall biosynthesis